MQGGANADLLREIRAVMRRLPEMTVKWVKVKVHRKREAETYHEVINNEMDTLANTLHDNIEWQSKETAQHFTSALAELKYGIRIAATHESPEMWGKSYNDLP